MSVIISYSPIQYSTSLLFSVVTGITTSYYAGFEWYLNDVLVGTESTYTLVSPSTGDRVYAKVKDYITGCPVYWYDGQFYGGNFTGNFTGGTFHYGYLNGAQYPKLPKPKPFIIK